MEKKYLSLCIPFMMYGFLFIVEYAFLEHYQIIDMCLNLFIITFFLFLFVRKFTMKRKIDYFFLIAFCVYVFYLHQVVFPFTITPILSHTEIQNPSYLMWGVNLVPFREIGSFFRQLDRFHLQDTQTFFFVGNLLMFAPFAFILAYFQLMKTWKIVPFICFLSLGVEVLQFVQTFIFGVFISDFGGIRRSTDIDDVILNTCSALFGILAFQIYTKVSKLVLKEKSVGM